MKKKKVYNKIKCIHIKTNENLYSIIKLTDISERANPECG